MAHWIVDDKGFGGVFYKCSNCSEYRNEPDEKCSNCGAEMDEENVYLDEINPPKKKIDDKHVLNILLSKEMEISHKFHNTVEEILRLGYDNDRGRAEIDSLIKSVKYSLIQLENQINVINKQ